MKYVFCYVLFMGLFVPKVVSVTCAPKHIVEIFSRQYLWNILAVIYSNSLRPYICGHNAIIDVQLSTHYHPVIRWNSSRNVFDVLLSLVHNIGVRFIKHFVKICCNAHWWGQCLSICEWHIEDVRVISCFDLHHDCVKDCKTIKSCLIFLT